MTVTSSPRDFRPISGYGSRSSLAVGLVVNDFTHSSQLNLVGGVGIEPTLLSLIWRVLYEFIRLALGPTLATLPEFRPR